jgi:DNA-binding beta-propeller fold protein YncE
MRKLALGLPLLALLPLAGRTAAQQPAPGYHVVQRYTLGGEGGWDYLALDTVNERLFLTRGDRVVVVDPERGAEVGVIPGLQRAHGVAFDYADGRGFATSGGDSTVTMFDLKTLRVLGTIPTSADDDAILYDPATKRVFTFDGDANAATVIDPSAGRRVATLALGAKPESGVSDGEGRIFVNLEDAGQIVEVDARALKVLRRWSLAPCEEPTGIAIDEAHHRLFSGCGNRLMAVSDAAAGRLVASVPVGAGVDADRFDPATGYAFSSNGDGSITVVHEDDPDHYSVVQTLPTMRGARTMELDPRTHRLYTVSAEFGTAAAGQRRPPMLPGTFTLLVIEPCAPGPGPR